MLIIKQMDIWRLQHQRRMYIMGLFGAPFWMQSASLYKAVILDSIIAAILVGIFYKLLPGFTDFESISSGVGLDLNNFKFFIDTLKLILISLAISIVSVSIVMLRQKNQ
jgi:cell division transport system permease protein